MLKTCGKCGGDLVLEDDELKCFQCGERYYPADPLLDALSNPPEDPPVEDPLLEVPNRKARKRQPYGINVNAVVASQERRTKNFWRKNKAFIQYLDEGRSIKEIHDLTGKGERQIRNIQVELQERQAAGEPSTLSQHRSTD